MGKTEIMLEITSLLDKCRDCSFHKEIYGHYQAEHFQHCYTNCNDGKRIRELGQQLDSLRKEIPDDLKGKSLIQVFPELRERGFTYDDIAHGFNISVEELRKVAKKCHSLNRM